jgi:GNAT superfamily N-acetyltransferase
MLIELPKGYSFEVIQLSECRLARINLLHDDEIKQRPGSGATGSYGQIGSITLEKVWKNGTTYNTLLKSKQLQTHSSLKEEYRGKGLGALMYAYAINYALERGYSVRCSYNRSENAKNVWAGKTLRKFFRIKSRVAYKGYSGTRLIYHAYPR